MRPQSYIACLVCVLAPLTFGAASSAFAAPTPATTPSTTIITACVGKANGRTRIVAKPSDCDAHETVLQFNQQGPAGPAGPAGPQGVAGIPGPAGPAGKDAPALVRTLLVPAAGSATDNGTLLVAAINAAATMATPAQPYLLQLDAGFYTLPNAGVIVPPNISLKGAGMYVTIVYSGGVAFTFIDTINNAGAIGASFSVSDMWIQSPLGNIVSANVGGVVIDHVRSTVQVSLASTGGNGDVLISNSILNGNLVLADTSGATRFRIVGSEVDTIVGIPQLFPGTLGCFASYNVRLVPYAAGCD